MAMQPDRALEGCLPSAPRLWESAELSIAMGKTSMNGFADLLVRARISRWTGESQPREERREERAVYRYDGARYRVHRYEGSARDNSGASDEAWWLR